MNLDLIMKNIAQTVISLLRNFHYSSWYVTCSLAGRLVHSSLEGQPVHTNQYTKTSMSELTVGQVLF